MMVLKGQADLTAEMTEAEEMIVVVVEIEGVEVMIVAVAVVETVVAVVEEEDNFLKY